jgi:Ca2+/Na+ antiporter
MGVVPGDIETTQQPPMTIPLRHFLIGIGFLVLGVLVGGGIVLGVAPGFASLAHVHVLLVGWVCVTIMGAMTQFVPVWSGVGLYSRRLANLQLVLVVLGLSGFVLALTGGHFAVLPAVGAVLLAGFWVFVYNVGRTLAALESLDVTERHFALALGFFLALSVLGYALAVDLGVPVLEWTGHSRVQVRSAHATVAVFGAILTTIYGALYQLGTMFTQTELHGIDGPLQRIEALAHPLGVVLLAGGRVAEWTALARVGGGLVLLAALCVGVVLARKLAEMRVPWTPMHTRYGVVAVSLLAWAALSAPAWIRNPLARANLLGAPTATYLLALGVIGFVVLGTLYHVVPFVVWVHRYSDRLGYEPVPMVDDLYSDRLASVDATLLVGGTIGLLVAGPLGYPTLGRIVGGSLVCLGVFVFVVNIVLLLREHSPHSIPGIIFGGLLPDVASHTDTEETAPQVE